MKHKNHKHTDHKEDASLQEKAGEIFEAMGYEVQYDRCFPGCKIDIFAKKKKTISSDYESWVCLVDNGKRNVSKGAVAGLYQAWQMIKQELSKESNLYTDCQAMLITGKGFTKGATAAARKYDIVLKKLNQLREEKEEFIKELEKQIQEFYDLIRASVDMDRWASASCRVCSAGHLIVWRVLRTLVEKHKDWESYDYDTVERHAADIVQTVGKQKWE